MPGHDIIVIGASAGGVETLTRLVKALPADLPAAVFVVLHVSRHSNSALPKILSRAGKLPATHPRDGQAIVHGQIYVAPPDFHLLIREGSVHLVRGPTENGNRPAIDPLFRTAARAYGPRVVGVVLTGLLDDGSAGLYAIKSRGGVAVVQDPDDAVYDGMPRSAIENVKVDHVLSASLIPPLLVKLAEDPVDETQAPPVSEEIAFESEIEELDLDALQSDNRVGNPSGFACPDCGGALWEVHDGHLVRFRCRTGHAFSPESLLAHQSEALESALWTALRALEERAALARKLARESHEHGRARSEKNFERQAADATRNVALIREALIDGMDHPIVETSPTLDTED